jgi:type IV pilus assembly protein PilM
MARKTAKLPAAVGLDIGSEMIKVVEAKNGKNGPTITGLGICPIPEGAIENSLILDPVAVGQAIKALLAENGIKTKPVISAVAGQSSVVVRVIEVPRMTREELTETMKFEVERQVPLPLSEVLMDFEPIERPGDPPDPQSMEVLLAVAQQDMVNRHVEALFAAGLAPNAIDVEPLASSRALIETDPVAKNQTVAIIDIGANSTDFDIYDGGMLVFACPPLQIAGITFTQAISEYLQIPMDEAEKLKRQYGAVDFSKIGGTAGDTVADPDSYTAFDLGDTAYSEPPAQPDTPPEPLVEPVQDEYQSPFDLGEGTGEPKTKEPTQPDNDIYTVGEEEVEPPAKPVFDLDGEMPFDTGLTAEPDEEPTSSFDLGFDDAAAQPHEVSPVPVHQSARMSDEETKERVAEAIGPVLVDLAAELRRFLEYYQTKYFTLPEKIIVSGGTAKMRGLDRFLETELGIPVQSADPLKHVAVSCPRHSEPYLREIAPFFSVSIGLAVREMLPD